MDNPYARTVVKLSRRTGIDDNAYTGREQEARDDWQRLVDARLIGNIPEMSAANCAAIDAWERVLGVGKYKCGGVR